MVEKLRTGKWSSDLATAEEMAAKVEEIRRLVSKYGFINRSVHPYGYAIGIDKFLAGFKDYSRCTHSSKQIMLAEINGFIPILNHWIDVEEQPKVIVRFITGKHKGEIKEIPESYVRDYIDCGLAERV